METRCTPFKVRIHFDESPEIVFLIFFSFFDRYLRSKMQLLNDGSNQELTNFIKRCFENDSLTEYLQKHFSFEISQLFLENEKKTESELWLSDAIDNLLCLWARRDCLNVASQESLFHKCQLIANCALKANTSLNDIVSQFGK